MAVCPFIYGIVQCLKHKKECLKISVKIIIYAKKIFNKFTLLQILQPKRLIYKIMDGQSLEDMVVTLKILVKYAFT